MSVKRMTNISMMTCLVVVCSWLTIPSIVPFTMQTFAVFCALLLLGGKDGTVTLGLYILLGCIGLPVFSGFQGGVGVILGPTGGYIIGFVLSALCYFILEKFAKRGTKNTVFVLILCLIVCYATGTLWFLIIYSTRGVEYSVISVLSMCVFPFIIPDLLKLFMAVFVCKRIKKSIT